MERMWELKQAATPNTLDLYIYGDVKSDYRHPWTDELIRSETSANAFREELSQNPTATHINIYINSWGGSVFEGTAIYNQLKRHSAHKTVYVDGFACSIASVIAMAGDEVVMPRNTSMLIHNMSDHACGNPAELRKAADELDVINAIGRTAYLMKAGGKLKEDELIRMMDAETWLSAEECIRYGLADRFAEQDADMTKANEILKNASLSISKRIEVQKSLSAQLKQFTQSQPVQHQPPKTLADIISGMI